MAAASVSRALHLGARSVSASPPTSCGVAGSPKRGAPISTLDPRAVGAASAFAARAGPPQPATRTAAGRSSVRVSADASRSEQARDTSAVARRMFGGEIPWLRDWATPARASAARARVARVPRRLLRHVATSTARGSRTRRRREKLRNARHAEARAAGRQSPSPRPRLAARRGSRRAATPAAGRLRRARANPLRAAGARVASGSRRGAALALVDPDETAVEAARVAIIELALVQPRQTGARRSRSVVPQAVAVHASCATRLRVEATRSDSATFNVDFSSLFFRADARRASDGPAAFLQTPRLDEDERHDDALPPAVRARARPHVRGEARCRRSAPPRRAARGASQWSRWLRPAVATLSGSAWCPPPSSDHGSVSFVMANVARTAA